MLKPNHFEGQSNLNESHRKSNTDKVLQELLPQPLTSNAGAGGGATETLVVPGLKTSDTIVSVYQKVDNANSLPLLAAVNGSDNGELDCEWSADPGAGAVVAVLVLRDVKNA